MGILSKIKNVWENFNYYFRWLIISIFILAALACVIESAFYFSKYYSTVKGTDALPGDYIAYYSVILTTIAVALTGLFYLFSYRVPLLVLDISTSKEFSNSSHGVVSGFIENRGTGFAKNVVIEAIVEGATVVHSGGWEPIKRKDEEPRYYWFAPQSRFLYYKMVFEIPDLLLIKQAGSPPTSQIIFNFSCEGIKSRSFKYKI